MCDVLCSTELRITLEKGQDIPENIGEVEACVQFSTTFAADIPLTYTAAELANFNNTSMYVYTVPIKCKVYVRMYIRQSCECVCLLV